MKNTKIKALLLLSLLIIVGTFKSNAQNVYTFTKNGETKTLAIKDIRSFTFPKGEMKINLKNGVIQTIPFADLTKLTFKLTNGLENIPKLSSLIQIYPNPVEELLHINCKNIQSDSDFNLQIISIEGKTVYNKKLSKTSDINKVNVSHWRKGVYFVYIKTDKQRYTKKFIKK